jgi:hypothetical protein
MTDAAFFLVTLLVMLVIVFFTGLCEVWSYSFYLDEKKQARLQLYVGMFNMAISIICVWIMWSKIK